MRQRKSAEKKPPISYKVNELYAGNFEAELKPPRHAPADLPGSVEAGAGRGGKITKKKAVKSKTRA